MIEKMIYWSTMTVTVYLKNYEIYNSIYHFEKNVESRTEFCFWNSLLKEELTELCCLFWSCKVQTLQDC